MKKLSIAYFGSPDFSANFLEKILNDKNLPVKVEFVVTQPDKPAGRKQIITPCPVKTIAQKYNLKVFSAIGDARERVPDSVQPDMLSGEPWRERNSRQNLLRQLDIALVYAYGKIIPTEFLSLPRLGFWNIHPSLLPKYRGPSPIATPLINGDTETGVSLIRLTEKIDAGPIINQKKMKIDPYDRLPDVVNKLTCLAYDLFLETINSLTRRAEPLGGARQPVNPPGRALWAAPVNTLILKKQNERQASYTKIFKKENGYITFENLKFKILNSPKQLFNLFRGLYPWPGLWTIINVNGQEKRLKITDVDFVKGKLLLKKTQLEGKKEVDFKQFNAYYKVL